LTPASNDQYMGWAPFPPGVEFRAGMNFNSSSMDIPLNFWVFIQGPHFQDLDLNPYVLPFERNQTIVNFTSMHNNMYTRNNRIINEGMGLDEVRRITGRAVPVYALQNAAQAGRTKIVGQQIQIYRPDIRQNVAAKPKVFLNGDRARQELAPAKVFDPRGQQSLAAEAAAVQKRQIQEKTLLATTQAQEIRTMQLKRDQEAKQVSGAAAKAKVNTAYEARITDLRKNHAVETQQITARHQNDVAQVKKFTQAPPNKKK
jgi:preprotein translocase subunit SecD